MESTTNELEEDELRLEFFQKAGTHWKRRCIRLTDLGKIMEQLYEEESILLRTTLMKILRFTGNIEAEPWNQAFLSR